MYPSKIGPTFGIFIKNQADQLIQIGMNVDIVAIDNPNMGRYTVIKKYLIWFLHFLSNFIFKGRKYDIVHVHYIFPTGILGLFYKKLYKKPMVVTAHGGDIDKMAKKNKLFKKCTAYILKQADFIICVGEELNQTVQKEYHVTPDKITTLNMGVDTNIFFPMDRLELRAMYDIPYTANTILFVGNIIKAKGVFELIKAYKCLKLYTPEARLEIIGSKKEPDFFKSLEIYIKEENIQDIFFHEPKSQKEIAVWMNMSDVFVLPSHIEGLGLVALEAMACNVPVAGAAVGGLAYLLSNEAGVLFPPKNPESIEHAIENIFNNKELNSKRIATAYNKALESNSENVINKLTGIYNSIQEIPERRRS